MATSAPWIEQTLDALAAQPAIGYAPGASVAAEPTALAALALAGHERLDAARAGAEALAKMQGENGTVGVRIGEAAPCWPTSLAIVVWQAVDPERFCSRTDRAIAWLLNNRGAVIPRTPDFGHDTTLVGWAYAEQTHSWVEPTALAVFALKAAGQADHPAAREGIAVLLDRQLPGGGFNYGNTFVLGQLIRPHVQPTGMALLALSANRENTGRSDKSIGWLRRNIGPETTPLSLGWAVLGLRAHQSELLDDEELLMASATKASSLHKRALLALAAKGWAA